ncbi:alpha-mannosidase [Lapidilactobacillus bayanensis]|uniref:alpha-mannosidase n=1 Tax=Lapidilactobacillus bayanensis TaxID=2485998 RepID=UPI000F7908CE|nr:alpha-mannosidase [Lapidilactobacillus bayanensis]
MFSTQKVKQQLNYLKGYVYANFETVPGLQLWHDTRESRLTVPNANVDWQAIAIGDAWEGRDQYYWLQFQLTVPALQPEQRYVLHLNLGRTGGGNNSGFEGLVYLDGETRQAVDSNHQDLYLDQSDQNKTIKVQIMMWTGLEGGGPQQIQHYTLKTVSAGILNETIRDTYRYLKLINETMTELSEDEPLLYDYQKLLNHSLCQLFWGSQSYDEITGVCHKVMLDIKAFISEHANEKKGFNIAAIGHTHIDVAWLWRLRHTREKTARSFSTVLELMKEYPEYKFFHSTPQVYQFIKQDHPELYTQIKKRVAEGRWEADGGTWLELDANIPSGESFTRQFLYGSQYFAKEFGAKQTVLWLPDVFGYSWALPQIMKGFGVENFMTTKISWNDTNRMPHDTFVWEGIDGSKVLTHFVTTTESESDFHDLNNWMYTYNGLITPHTVMGTYHVYADKALNNDLLLSYGFGDGGGGPQREMIENIEMINELPGLPTIKNTRVDDYFVQLRQNLKDSELPIPTWNGELYLEFHRGTYTSQARVKKQNRELEFQLRNLEMRYTQALLEQGIDYPQEQINELWEMVLRNQFHDILPGSAIHEVYQDNQKEYQDGFTEIAQLNAKLDIKQLTIDPQYQIVRNYNAWSTTQLVHIDNTNTGQYVDAEGIALVTERTATGYDILVTVPALQAYQLCFVPSEHEEVTSTEAHQDDHIENNRYRIKWNDAGQLTEVFDKVHQRQVLAKADLGNVLSVYEDRPVEYDNWNIDEDYTEKQTVLAASNITITQATALQIKVVFQYQYLASTIKQTLTIDAHSPKIDFVTEVDWHEHQQLLRTAFDMSVLANEATFDVQYGNVKRPTNSNTSWDEAKFETVAHKWADLSQRDYGVALLNDSKYGYSVKENVMSLSLIKSGINPDTEADQGHHSFTYSLLPHEGDFVTGHVEQVAQEMNNPLIVTAGKIAQDLTALFDFQAANVVDIDAIKLSEDQKSVILRFHEYTGQNGVVTVKPNFAYQSVAEVRLDEVTEVESLAKATDYQINVRPYQVVTLAFTR